MTTPKQNPAGSSSGAIIGAVVGVVAGLIVIVVVFLVIRHRRKGAVYFKIPHEPETLEMQTVHGLMNLIHPSHHSQGWSLGSSRRLR
jgi:hypothetical protein